MEKLPKTLESGVQFIMRNGSFWAKRDPNAPLIILWDIVSSNEYTTQTKHSRGRVEYIFEPKILRALELLFNQAQKQFSNYFNIRFVRHQGLVMPMSSDLYDPRIRLGLVKGENMVEFAGYAFTPGQKFAGDIALNIDDFSDLSFEDNFATLVHEMGHALGLGHTHLSHAEEEMITLKKWTGFNLGISEEAIVALEHITSFDSGDLSIMSYQCQQKPGAGRRTIGLGILDYIALGRIYGYKPSIQKAIDLEIDHHLNENLRLGRDLNRGVIVPEGIEVLRYRNTAQSIPDQDRRPPIKVYLSTKPYTNYGPMDQYTPVVPYGSANKYKPGVSRFVNISHVPRLESHSHDHVTFAGSHQNEQFQGGYGHDNFFIAGGHDVVEIDMDEHIHTGHDVIEDLYTAKSLDLIIRGISENKLVFCHDGNDLTIGPSAIQIREGKLIGAGYLLNPSWFGQEQKKSMTVSLAYPNILQKIKIADHISSIAMAVVLTHPMQSCLDIRLPENTYECLVLYQNKKDWMPPIRHVSNTTLRSLKTQQQVVFYHEPGVTLTFVSNDDMRNAMIENMPSSITLKNAHSFLHRLRIFCDYQGQRKIIDVGALKKWP